MQKIMKIKRKMKKNELYNIFLTGVGILINCLEHSQYSRQQFIKTVMPCDESSSALKFIANLLIQTRSYQKQLKFFKEKKGHSTSTKTTSSSSLLLPSDKNKDISNILEIEKNVIQKSSKSLENLLTASYTALLLGCVCLPITDQTKTNNVLSSLTEINVPVLVGILKEFLVLQSDANLLTEDALETVVNIIEIIKRDELL